MATNVHLEQNEVEASSTEVIVADPEDVIKHPLENNWVFWYFKNNKNFTYSDNWRYIIDFSTVEDFWSGDEPSTAVVEDVYESERGQRSTSGVIPIIIYNNIQNASRLICGCDYAVFKEGIKPMWEDGGNRKGGRWLINMSKGQHTDLDNAWLEILLCLIGEAFEEQSCEICGAVVNVRVKQDKLGLWTCDFSHSDPVMKIGQTLRKRLRCPDTYSIGYEAHEDTITKSASIVKQRYQA